MSFRFFVSCLTNILRLFFTIPRTQLMFCLTTMNDFKDLIYVTTKL